MAKTLRLTLAVVAVAGLAACSDREIGSEVDTGQFGNATMHNTLNQQAYEYRQSHGKYAGTTRVLKRQGPPLNGKYAEKIFEEHINDALRPHPGNTSVTTQVNESGG